MNIDTIYAVIVLYNCSLDKSSTVKSINKALTKANTTLDILIYDNSLIAQCKETNFTFKNLKCNYIHNPNNPGIAEAYNVALNEFNKTDKQWLLLLDQDTHFSGNFFTKIKPLKINDIYNIGAVIPKVVSLNGEDTISPMKMKTGGLVREIKDIKPGTIKQNNITGINSGTLLSKSFLKTLNKFDERFPLDMLDHWYFRELQNRNYKVYLLNIIIHQELSINNIENEMYINRYKKLLHSEKMFLNSSFIDLAVFKARLIFRLKKQIFFKEKAFFYETLKHIL